MITVAQTNIGLYRQLVEAQWSSDDLARCVAAYDFAMPLFAMRFRASGKPFLAHLVGVASLLAAEKASPDIVIAGLLHAVYAQGRFGFSDLGVRALKQGKVTRVFGDRVACLVDAYDRQPWDFDTIAALGKADEIDARLYPVLLMRIANEVEDNIDCAERFSAKRSRANDPEIHATIARLARKLGHPALAIMLKESVEASNALDIPRSLTTNHQKSFAISGRSGWIG